MSALASGAARAVLYQAYRLGRKLVRLPGVGRLIPSSLRSRVHSRLVLGVVDQLPDRRYMREAILPALAAEAPRTLLDVGVDSYSREYAGYFPDDCAYWTLDFDPKSAAHVPPERHLVADLLDAGAHFAPGSLDVVLLNGPFGFGLDRLDQQERAVEVVAGLLRPGGWMLVGWNRGQDGRPVVMDPASRGEGQVIDPTELASARASFARQAPGGLPTRIDFADSSHVYDWFRRKADDEG